MKRILTALSLILLITFSATAGDKPVGKTVIVKSLAYQIKFKVHGLHDSTCYLGYFYGKNQFVKQDTCKADKEGNLVFDGTKALPRGVYILYMPKLYLELMMDNDQFFSMETDTADVIANMKVEGSEENKLFYDYQQLSSKRSEEADKIKKEMKGKVGLEKDALQHKLESIDKEMNEYRKKLISEKPNTLTVKLMRGATEVEVPDAPKDKDGKILDSNFQ